MERQAHEDHLLPAPLGQGHADGDGEQQEPQVAGQGDGVDHAVGHVEIGADVVRHQPDHVDKSHGEESEHHGQDDSERILFHTGIIKSCQR